MDMYRLNQQNDTVVALVLDLCLQTELAEYNVTRNHTSLSKTDREASKSSSGS